MCRKVLSFLVLMVFIGYFAGCSSMRFIAPDEISTVGQESRVWVTMADGTRYELREPRIEGGKLVGYVESAGYREIDPSEIASLAVKKLDQTKTIVWTAFGIAGAVVFISVLNGWGGDSESCST